MNRRCRLRDRKSARRWILALVILGRDKVYAFRRRAFLLHNDTMKNQTIKTSDITIRGRNWTVRGKLLRWLQREAKALGISEKQAFHLALTHGLPLVVIKGLPIPAKIKAQLGRLLGLLQRYAFEAGADCILNGVKKLRAKHASAN